MTIHRYGARATNVLGELLPSSGHPDLAEPDGYLALLRSIPDGAGGAGFQPALRRHAEAHPLREPAA